MNLKEIIYNTQNLLSKGKQEQTNPLSDRQVLFIIEYYWNKLVEQQLEKNGNTEPVYQIDLGLLQLEKVDKTTETSNIECSSIINAFTTSCIYRIQIPQPLYYNNYPALNYVGTADFSKYYSYYTINKLIRTKHFKYTSDFTKYFIIGNYIYIVAPETSSFKFIRVIGVFNSPYKALELKNDIIDFNIEYPITGKMLDTIYKLMNESEIRTYLQSVEDKTNDFENESSR